MRRFNLVSLGFMKSKSNLIQSYSLAAAILHAAACGAQTTVTHIATGFNHTLFVKSDGSLWTIGANYVGQLGDGGGPYSATNQPQMIVSSGVTAVFAAGDHGFFTIGSALWAMGDNIYGELGDGTTIDRSVPEQITGVITVGAGLYHTLFTRSSGFYVDLYATGDNEVGELGDGTFNEIHTPERIERDNSIEAGDYYVTAVAGGDFHTLFTKSDGSLWAVGDDYVGELGDGNYLNNGTNRPEKIVASGVTVIAAGDDDSMFIKSDGSLWTMGYNQYGQLGALNVPTGFLHGFTNRPVEIETSGVTAIAAGESHNLFLKSDGSLWGMGNNAHGQLGDGNTNNAIAPLKIVAGGVTAIAAGEYHSLFLAFDGSLWGMGYNGYGQLGARAATNLTRPVQIVGPIVANGGFETHDFTGWTLSAAQYNSVVTGLSHSGQWSARFGQVGSPAFLSQTLLTSPGTNYLLSFWLNCDGQAINEFTASWNGTAIFAQTNLPATTGWTNMQFVVAATGTSTVLTFGFRDDPGYIGLDDVSVVPLSLPAITGISLAGTNVVLTANNGLWNGTYLTLTSTNLTQPLSQWTPVATNTLDGSGTFTIILTNAVNAGDSKRFYALKLE
jgi:alpha-tubulin suppressor-like RCC1 family protein